MESTTQHRAHQTLRRTANFPPGVPVDEYSQIEPVALFFLVTLDAMTPNFQTNLYEQKYTPSASAATNSYRFPGEMLACE